MSISHAYLMSVNQMVQHIYLSKCYPLSKHYSKAFSFTSLLKDGSEASLLFYRIGSLHMFLSVYIYPLNAYSQCIFYLWWWQVVVNYLVFVQLTVLVLLFSLFLKCDDDETNEDVHHEESNDDDVDNKEDGDLNPVIIDGSHILHVGINGPIQQPESKQDPNAEKICNCLQAL